MKLLTVLSFLLAGCSAWSTGPSSKSTSVTPETSSNRRSFLTTVAGGMLAVAAATPTLAQAQDDIEWTPFNGLIFNYRNSGFNGLDASTLDEPSIPFLEFGKKLANQEVEFVEFLAPDGDAAYVTFKAQAEAKKEAPIRIGEGYPIEQHDGYSSPFFVVRALQNYNVPYKFTVPGMEQYRIP